jgi:hypothetical protein
MYQEFSRLNRSRFRAYPRKTPERTDDRIDRAIDRTTDRTTDGASRRVVDRDPSVATSVRRDVRSGCSDASRSTPPRTISRSFSVAAWLARTVSPDPWVWIFEPRERVRRPKNEARRNRPKATRATAVRRGEATTIDRSIPPAREREPRKNATRFHPLRFISNHHRRRRVSLFQPRRSFRSLPSARSTRVRIGTPSLVARSSSSSRAFILVVARVPRRRRVRRRRRRRRREFHPRRRTHLGESVHRRVGSSFASRCPARSTGRGETGETGRDEPAPGFFRRWGRWLCLPFLMGRERSMATFKSHKDEDEDAPDRSGIALVSGEKIRRITHVFRGAGGRRGRWDGSRSVEINPRTGEI